MVVAFDVVVVVTVTCSEVVVVKIVKTETPENRSAIDKQKKKLKLFESGRNPIK